MRRGIRTALVSGAVLVASCSRVATAAEVINAGRGGHNTRNLLARLERDVLARKPSLVVLMVGTNDVLNSRNAVPLKEYEANLRKLIGRILAAKSRVLLLTIPPCHEAYLLRRHPASFYQPDGPTARIRKANRVVQQIAEASKAPGVDVFALFTEKGAVGTDASSWLRNEANSRAADGVHPTAEGYRAIAAAVAKAIARHKLPASRVVCLGDSITFGAGVKGAGTATGETWPACLARLLSDSSDRDEKGNP